MIFRKDVKEMDEKTKATMLKYRKNAREQIQVDMAKGMKAKIKAYAESKGMSMSALILQLLEHEMRFDGFNEEWAKSHNENGGENDAEREAVVNAIKAGMKPPVKG